MASDAPRAPGPSGDLTKKSAAYSEKHEVAAAADTASGSVSLRDSPCMNSVGYGPRSTDAVGLPRSPTLPLRFSLCYQISEAKTTRNY